MNPWLAAFATQAAKLGPNQPACSALTDQHVRRQVRLGFRQQVSGPARGSLFRLLVRMPVFSGLLLLATFAPHALGQSAVTLAWDPSPGSGIAGYLLYEGTASGSYSDVIDVGESTTATASNLVSGTTYYLAVKAYDTGGLESDFSSEITYTVPWPSAAPSIVLTTPVNGASYLAPATVNLAASVTANGHSISQVRFYRGAELLGTVASTPYSFSWSNVVAGTYSLSAMAVYDTGNALSSALNVTVTNVLLPSVALIFPVSGASYSVPGIIPLFARLTTNGYTISQVQFYNGALLLGAVVAPPYRFTWTNVSAGSYAVTARAVYASGSTVSSAPANVTVAAPKPPSGLTFAADSGTFTAPFVDSNGTLSQPTESSLANGGRAVYNFNIVSAGNYLVSAMVMAPSEGQNSFYVNIDSEPTDPLMIWDIPVCSALSSATVSWRGTGNGDPASSQYSPKSFYLSAGTHQLIILGREVNTTLGKISIAARPPRLGIGTAAVATAKLSGLVTPPPTSMTLYAEGEPGQAYEVRASQDFVRWILIGTMTLDADGLGEFTDPAGTQRPKCFYRLQGQ